MGMRIEDKECLQVIHFVDLGSIPLGTLLYDNEGDVMVVVADEGGLGVFSHRGDPTHRWYRCG